MCIQDYLNIWRLMWFGFWTTVAISNGMSYVIVRANVLFNLISRKQSISLIFPEALINLFCVKWNWTRFTLSIVFFLSTACFLCFDGIVSFVVTFLFRFGAIPLPIQISLIHCHNQWSVNFAVCFVIFSLPWLHFSNSKSG